MFKDISTYNYVIWGVSIILQAVLADIIFKYRHHKTFPAFATYISLSLVSSVVLLSLSVLGSQKAYFLSYWAAQVLVLAILFCVVHEVCESVTKRATSLSPAVKRALIRMATLGAAIAVAASLHVPSTRYPLMEAIASLQRGFGLAIFTFMSVLIIVVRIYSVEWYRRDSGIALGIFLDYSFQTLWPRVSAFLSGTAEQRSYLTLVLGCDAIALLVWIYSFAQASHLGDFFTVPIAKKRFRVILGGKYWKHRHDALRNQNCLMSRLPDAETVVSKTFMLAGGPAPSK